MNVPIPFVSLVELMPNKAPYNPVNLQLLTDHHSIREPDLQEIRVERLQAGSETRSGVGHSSPVATELHARKDTAQNQNLRPHRSRWTGGLYQLTALVWEFQHYASVVNAEVAAERKKKTVHRLH